MSPANNRVSWLAAVSAALTAATSIAATPAQAGLSVDPGTLVLREDFPDPFLLAVKGGYLAYATNSAERRINVQLATSPDLKTWQLVDRDAMPVLPPWARPGYTWAPEVLAVDRHYNLYFTARDRRSGLQCVGVASANDPQGPFTSQAIEPLVCQRDLGGSIDPSPFRDADGATYLLFKNDGNNPRANLPTTIWAQRLTPDGLALTGAATPLLSNTAAWEGRVIEAPTMLRLHGRYVLLFSANDYGWQRWQAQSHYAMGYTVCASVTGPCRPAPEKPLLASQASGPGGCLSGPGHQAVLQQGDRLILAYHAWDATRACGPATDRRLLHIGELYWHGEGTEPPAAAPH